MAPWDLGRFIQTLDYFQAIPIVSQIQTFSQPRPTAKLTMTPDPQNRKMLFNFGDDSIDLSRFWGALDDVVMGGVSNSSVRIQDGFALFSGIVSTDNNGGFASIRTRNFDPPIDLSDCTGIELRLRGDGNRYKFLGRDANEWDSIGYSYSFDTVANEWITIQIPFASMIPVFRAKTLPSAAPIDSSRIRSMQLMLSKFEYDGGFNPSFNPGAFRLDVTAIAGYRN